MEGDSRNPQVSLLRRYDIPIDHLSFEYVETCNDKKELERIARILRSGEEGSYPDLLNAVESKLRQIAPESRALRIETPVMKKEYFSNEEWEAFEKDLEAWENEMRVLDIGLEFEKKRFDSIGSTNLPGIRKVSEPKPKVAHDETGSKRIKVETKQTSERIKSGDYEGWDRFDVDKELLKLDLEDERKEEKIFKARREMEKEARQFEEKKGEPLNIDPASYTEVEQQVLAIQAKERGNECFKSGDYELALKYYKVSLKLHPTTATYNNRAITYIKMRNFEDALKDCNEVLRKEPNNIKALHRRATAYQNLCGENYNELALEDLSQIILLEPTNKVAQTDMQFLRSKLNLQDIGRKFRMMIEENDHEEIKEFLTTSQTPRKEPKKSYCYDEDEIVDIRKLPLTYYGPSTSTFQCEPHSLTHRMLSDPNFSGQVMCKCNSNATKQNPLCHACGERLSRPKKKSKPKTPKASIDIKEISQEKSKTEVEGENKFKTAANGKSNVKADSTKQSASGSKSRDFHGKKYETKSEFKIASIKREEQNNNEFEADSKINLKGGSVGNAGGEEAIQNVINEWKYELSTEEANVSYGEIDAEIKTTGEINGNSALQEPNLAEIENQNDIDQWKYLEEIFAENLDLSDGKEQRNILPDEEGILRKMDEMIEKGKLTGNDDNPPTSSNQPESVSENKRSRSRKKKSREPRSESMSLFYPEPVKIVQAPKYLKPTSSEPKPESEKPKEDNRSHFKSFVPCKKRPTQNGSSSSTYQSDKGSRAFQQSYSSGDIARGSEGHRENIKENGDDPFAIKTPYSGEDPVPIGSSFEFMKSWESIRKTDESYEKRAQMIRYLRPEDLKKVIGNNLDSEMLKGILECLEKHFMDRDPKRVMSFLEELPRIPRFSIISLFLNQSEKEVLQRLIEKTEKRGYLLDEEVKNSLKTSF